MFSYGEGNTLVLDEHPVVQLVGKNGAGKSSIPLVIEELLYNKNSKGIKKAAILNRYSGATKYSGTVWFSKGDDSYVLEKTVASTAKVKLTKNGEDISGHTATQTYKLIELQVLGMDFKTFSKLVYQSMTSALDFLQATDANRKKFLMSLLNLEVYGTILDKLKSRSKEATQERDELVGQLSVIQSFLKSNPEKLELLEELEVPEISQELLAEAAALRVDLSNIEKVNKRVAEKRSFLAKITKLKSDEPANEYTEEDIVEYKKARDELHEQVQEATAIVTSIKRELHSLGGLHETCPTCGQGIEDNAGIEAKITELRTKLTKAETDKVKAQSEYRKLVDPYPAISKYNNWHKNLQELQELYSEHYEDAPDEEVSADSIKQQLAELEREYNSQKAAARNAQEHNNRVTAHNAKAENTNANIDDYSSRMDRVVGSKAKADEVLADFSVLLDAFGPKGLVQYKIESNIKTFEQLINDYLVKLSSGTFAISFSIEESKLAINVYQEGELVDISSVSSGEFNNINTATLLAVRTMMTAISKASINILFLDEVISVLDEDARTNLIDILLEEKGLNSVTVSHGFTHPLAHCVNIEKEDKISWIHD